nr:MAG TPA: sirfactant protein [Caudoviricetes sp.]
MKKTAKNLLILVFSVLWLIVVVIGLILILF